MSHKPAAAEECSFERRREQLVDLRMGVASASEAGEGARDAHHGSVVFAGMAPQTCMLNGKVGYYADFGIYSMLVVATVAFALRESHSDQLTWLAAAIAGGSSWTLVEYLLHRFVLHRMPLIADLHHVHHVTPRSYVSTPT